MVRRLLRRQRKHFKKVVQKKEQPQEIREYAIPDPRTISRAKVDENGIISLQSSDLVVLTGLASSRSEAKRLIKQGSVKVDGEKIMDGDAFIEARHGRIIQRGHLQFVKLVNTGK